MGKLTIQDIATILTQKNGLSKRDANNFASAMFTLIQERLETDHMVKVKGFGTFKMVDVDARESISVRTGERVVISGHTKVSFTPDATMKELVNKPFSQFETVMLNDGVEFADVKEESEEPVAETEPTPVMGSEPVVEFESTDTEKQAPAVMPLMTVEQSAPDVRKEPEIETVTVEEETPVSNTVEEPEPEYEAEADEEAEQENETTHPWGRWMLCGLAVLVLMALSAWGGYYYGTRHARSLAVADTVVVHDTIALTPIDTLTSVRNEPDSIPRQLKPATETSKVEPIAAPVKSEPAPKANSVKSEPAQKSAEQDADKYGQKDARVRLGAYRIVGLEREVKVLAGQTFISICRAHLGPDMECYVEVFNDLPQNPKVKEGQIIKIPKLQLKKKKK